MLIPLMLAMVVGSEPQSQLYRPYLWYEPPFARDLAYEVSFTCRGQLFTLRYVTKPWPELLSAYRRGPDGVVEVTKGLEQGKAEFKRYAAITDISGKCFPGEAGFTVGGVSRAAYFRVSGTPIKADINSVISVSDIMRAHPA